MEAAYYRQRLSDRFVVRVSSSLALHSLADTQAANQAGGRTPWHYSKACVIADASNAKPGAATAAAAARKNEDDDIMSMGGGGGGGGSGGKFRTKAEMRARRVAHEKIIPTFDA